MIDPALVTPIEPKILVSAGERYVVELGTANGDRVGQIVDLQYKEISPINYITSIGAHTSDRWQPYDGPLTAEELFKRAA